MCGNGRISVEALGDQSKTVDEGSDDRLPLSVALTGTSKNDFRPFCACVCGMYESVVARAAALLQAETITSSRLINVTQKTFKRSELAKLTPDELPKPPMELLVIAHKVSGQRNPITDQHGLYNNLLKHAWSKADVVLLCLFDVPPGYFSQLLNEQPTLRGLLCAGRLLPLFSLEESAGVDMDAEAETAAKAAPEAKPQEEAEAAWWLVRCLDGRVPQHDAIPSDGRKTDQVLATLTSVVSGAKEGGRKEQGADVATGTASASCTVAVLAHVAQDFEGKPLVRD
jgi:hypothetical protein